MCYTYQWMLSTHQRGPMGIGLTIMPLRGPREIGDESVLCYERLRFDEDYRIFEQLTVLEKDVEPTIKATDIPPQMWVRTYEDEGIEERREDNYGKELTFLYAQKMKRLVIPKDTSPKNKAIKAFIDALPDHIPIILLWS